MTAASPSEIEIGRAFGGVVLAHSRRPGPASHDGHGTRYVYVPPADDPEAIYALDVEAVDQPPPDAVQRKLASADLKDTLRIWTELEVAAKLRSIPAHVLLNQYVQSGTFCDRQAPRIDIVRLDRDNLLIAVGRQGK